jgi:hypothetical protein
MRNGLWNVRTLNESGKLKQLIKEMDILGLSEVRRKVTNVAVTQCYSMK